MYIRQLALYARDIRGLEGFYRSLGLPVRRSDMHLVIPVGRTSVTFHQSASATPYHYAINIPSGQIEEALWWLRQCADPLSFQGKDIVDFPNWNARSVYFYDPEKNIVELIARKNLGIRSAHPFSAKHMLGVSEIGIAPASIEDTYNWLNRNCGLDIYDGGFDTFCAIGDEHGLFITVDRDRKKWFPTDDVIYPSQLKLTFNHDGEQYNLTFDGRSLSKQPTF